MNSFINETLSTCQIEFETDDSSLLPEGKEAVKRVADVLQGFGAMDIEIHGHTGCTPICTGQCALHKLAIDRTETVKKVLMELAPRCKFTTKPWGCKNFTVGARKLVRIGSELD
jgi:outer membrane protein OmpA-like peptidoglycan-associated protein